MVTVHVPATSANVGSGFDVLGLALSLGNTVAMEEAEGCHITALDGAAIPTDEQNLVWRAAEALYRECAKPFFGLRLEQRSPIPATRGLGSSSACIVAGLLGANALLKNPCARQDLLNIAARMEGHPDNVAPAFLGGLVASCIEGPQVHCVKKEISPTLCFAAFVPGFELPTEMARAALPRTVPHANAVFNMARAVLCQAALCEGRLDLFPTAVEDRLQQPYRLPLIPGGEDIFKLARAAGALGAFVSGAGPAVLAVVEARNESFWPAAEAALAEAKAQGRPEGNFRLSRFEADNLGARLI